MEPAHAKLWPRYPGYDEALDDDEDPEEERLTRQAARRLPDFTRALGAEWQDVPCVRFTPPAKKSGGSLPLWCSVPSQWGSQGPMPKYRIERIRAPAVRETLESNGMRPSAGQDWALSWSGPSMKDATYQALHEYQRVNHFPGSSEMTKKDLMWLHFKKMAKKYGKDSFDFVPETFVMPEQQEEFQEVYQRTNHVWIVKPNAASQGKGIFLLRDLKDLPMKEVAVVSRYVDNPLLIQGLKFDMRIYVLVTSYEPLRAYIYREGLTRFASKPYSTKEEHLSDAYRHLTNYSINKFSQDFQENQELNADNVGHKWSLSALNRHLEHTGYDVDLMWARINDLIIKTLLSVEHLIAAKARKCTTGNNCFELYGFDVLVDDVLKPWLLEVNLSPCMSADSPLDWTIKSSCLADTFNLVGIRRADFQTIASARMRQRLQQLKLLTERQKQRSAMRDDTVADGNGEQPAEKNAEEQGSPDPAKSAQQKAGSFNPFEEPVVMEELGKPIIKNLAHALQEMSRRSNNFLRLYPTRETVPRYASILLDRKAQSGGSSSSSCLADTSKASTPPRHSSELLASLLFGPEPVDKVPKRRCLFAEASFATAVQGTALNGAESSEECPRSPGEASEQEEEDEQQEDVPFEDDAAFQDPTLAMSTRQALIVLGSKVGSRLAFMEYLIRICNACSGLGAATKAKLVESRAPRIAEFRRQLSVFLRTARIKGGNEDAFVAAEGKCSCLVDKLSAVAQATLSRLIRESWGPLFPVDVASSCGKGLNLEKACPAAFVATGSGDRAVSLLSSLSCTDLEGILQGPQCAMEYRSLMEAPDVTGIQAVAAVQNAVDKDGERPSSAELAKRIEEIWNMPTGPLGELRSYVKVVPAPRPTQSSPKLDPDSFSPFQYHLHSYNQDILSPRRCKTPEPEAFQYPLASYKPEPEKPRFGGPGVTNALEKAAQAIAAADAVGPKTPLKSQADPNSRLRLPSLAKSASSRQTAAAYPSSRQVPAAYPGSARPSEDPAAALIRRRLAKGGNAASMPALPGLLTQSGSGGSQDGSGSLWRKGTRHEANPVGGLRWKSIPAISSGDLLDDIEL